MKRLSRAERSYLLDHLQRSDDPKLIGIADKLSRTRGRPDQTPKNRLWAAIGVSLVRREMALMKANGERHKGGNKTEAERRVAERINGDGMPVGAFTRRLTRYGRPKTTNK